jgi:hypothetical protein
MNKGTIPVLPEGYASCCSIYPNFGLNLQSIAEIKAELAGDLNTGSDAE